MAFVINPDGTINLLKVEYDRSGNVRPKQIVDDINPSLVKSFKQQSNKKEHSVSSNKTVHTSAPNNDPILKRDKPLVKYATKTPEKKKIFQTKEAIDEYFAQRKELHQIVHQEILDYAEKHLDSEQYAYFMKCFNEHNDYCINMGWGPKVSEYEPKKKRKDAAFTPISNSSNGKSVNSRHPVYGYARDRYGRVQERDSLNEERKNEFRQSQSLQRRYDYSSYDSENDHDSYYESKSYD